VVIAVQARHLGSARGQYEGRVFQTLPSELLQLKHHLLEVDFTRGWRWRTSWDDTRQRWSAWPRGED